MIRLSTASSDLRFHAFTLSAYPLLLLVLAVALQHPLYLLVLLAAGLFALGRAGGWPIYWGMMRYSWLLLVLIVAINLLVSKDGQTLLWLGPDLPLLGKIRLTLESLAFSLTMVLRMLIVFAASALYITWLSADRALGLLSKLAKRSAVTAMLAARLVPYLAEQAEQIGDVMQTRGVRFDEGGLIRRLKARRPMLNVLLISSLEGSWGVAEAMEARGYGQGPRTSYTREVWSLRDLGAWLAMAAALVLLVLALGQGIGSYAFYPRLGDIRAGGAWTGGAALLLGVLLAMPPLLAKRRRR